MPATADHRTSGHRTVAGSTLVWNVVLPALGVALIVGASILPAIAIAAAVALAIHVVLAPRDGLRRWTSAHVVPRHALHGN